MENKDFLCIDTTTTVFHIEHATPTQVTSSPGFRSLYVLLSHWLLLFSGVADSFQIFSMLNVWKA